VRLRINCILLLLFLFSACFSQSNSPLLESIISGDPVLKNIIDKKQTYRPQIIYTQIDRDKNNHPIFKDHTYLLDSTNYFYCASLVKLPCSILALEKLNELNIHGLDRQTYMFTDKTMPCQVSVDKDTSSASGYPSIEHYIKKMLLVSDNSSYSRTFEFLNPKYIHKKLAAYGYPGIRIVHRFDPICKPEVNHVMNQIRFMDRNLELVYKQEADPKYVSYSPPPGDLVFGTDVYNKKKKLVSEKKDFTYSNYIPLSNIHSILKRVLFHNHLAKKDQFNISSSDWSFLVKHIGMYPREAEYPRYDPAKFDDSYKKYFMYGNKVKVIGSDTMRVFNMIGYSYGFLVDCAYIVNFKTKTEFMLTATVYTNARNSFGSGVYEYESIGIPFLKELSTAIYKLEAKRRKAYEPDLSEFDLYKTKEDSGKITKIKVNGSITVNGNPHLGHIIVKSINKHFLYYPEVASDKNGKFSLNLLGGEEYELEFNVKDSPPQIIDIDTKKIVDKDSINVYIDFMSARLEKMIKTKQDSLFLAMLKVYNKISLKQFSEKYGTRKLDELTFKVQIGAYKFIENFNYNSVAGMPIIIRETFDDYITRFTMGNYETYNEAYELLGRLKETKAKDAFIIAVYKGKRLYLNELIEKEILK
jgi:hypothetical protein